MVLVVRAVIVVALAGATAFAERPQPGWGPALAIGVTRSSIEGTGNIAPDYSTRTSMAVAFRASWQSRTGISVSTGLQVAQYGFGNGPHGLVREYMEFHDRETAESVAKAKMERRSTELGRSGFSGEARLPRCLRSSQQRRNHRRASRAHRRRRKR